MEIQSSVRPYRTRHLWCFASARRRRPNRNEYNTHNSLRDAVHPASMLICIHGAAPKVGRKCLHQIIYPRDEKQEPQSSQFSLFYQFQFSRHSRSSNGETTCAIESQLTSNTPAKGFRHHQKRHKTSNSTLSTKHRNGSSGFKFINFNKSQAILISTVSLRYDSNFVSGPP